MKLLHRLLLVRHGQAQSNKRGAFLGRQDDPLTELGRFQIASLRDRISDEAIDLVVASPLIRAKDSAEILVEDRDTPLELDSLLMEQDYGLWDGLTFTETAQRFSKDFDDWMTGNPQISPTGGENLLQVAARVKQSYQNWLPQVQPGGCMMLVGHAGALQTLLCELLGLNLCNQWPFMLQTGSLAELQLFDTGPRLTRLSWI